VCVSVCAGIVRASEPAPNRPLQKNI
jgi:hypothetical protein